jgi:hypothetical protein
MFSIPLVKFKWPNTKKNVVYARHSIALLVQYMYGDT